MSERSGHSILPKIAFGLRTRGLSYLLTAPRNEFVNPRLSITRHLRNTLVSASDLLQRRRTGTSAEDRLQFVYDLGISPVTFDFTSYLAGAEIERRLRGFDRMEVFFVMGPDDGVRRELAEYNAAVDPDARFWRVHNVLITMLALLPSVRSFTVCEDRNRLSLLLSRNPASIYPSDYRTMLPRQPAKRTIHEHARNGAKIWPMLSATQRGRRLVGELLQRVARGRRPVVITLRNYGFSPERNSRRADWLAFADQLDADRYVAIFVQDTETAMRSAPVDFGRHTVCEAASWNLEIRMALYEAAWLNMAVMHGPMELCWYNQDARYLLFLTVGTNAMTTAAALIENGHRVGVDLDFATPAQHIVWQPDILPTLVAEFRKMELNLEGRSVGPSG